MKNIFDSENFVIRFLTKLFDSVALSLVFTLMCLPIITIGPAITALYYSTVKSLRRDRGYVLREFFRSFKRDFKQSFLLEVILVIVFTILYVDIKISIEERDLILNSIRYLYLVIGVFFACLSIYAFPLISRFRLSLKELLKLSFYLSIRNIISTVVAAILLFGGFVSVYFSLGIGMAIIPVFTCLLISILLERILKQCMKFVKKSEDTGNKDEWYLE